MNQMSFVITGIVRVGQSQILSIDGLDQFEHNRNRVKSSDITFIFESIQMIDWYKTWDFLKLWSMKGKYDHKSLFA